MSGRLSVYWEGLGETCGEQTDFYESDRAVLKSVWTSLLMEAGVEKIEYFSAIACNTAEKKADVPYVSLVPIIQSVTEVKAAGRLRRGGLYGSI